MDCFFQLLAQFSNQQDVIMGEAKRRHEHKRFLANEKGVVLKSTIRAVCLGSHHRDVDTLISVLLHLRLMVEVDVKSQEDMQNEEVGYFVPLLVESLSEDQLKAHVSGTVGMTRRRRSICNGSS